MSDTCRVFAAFVRACIRVCFQSVGQSDTLFFCFGVRSSQPFRLVNIRFAAALIWGLWLLANMATRVPLTTQLVFSGSGRGIFYEFIFILCLLNDLQVSSLSQLTACAMWLMLRVKQFLDGLLECMFSIRFQWFLFYFTLFFPISSAVCNLSLHHVQLISPGGVYKTRDK